MVESGAGEVITTHSSVEEWWADGVRADAQWSFWLCFPFRRVSPLFFVHILFRLGPGGCLLGALLELWCQWAGVEREWGLGSVRGSVSEASKGES